MLHPGGLGCVGEPVFERKLVFLVSHDEERPVDAVQGVAQRLRIAKIPNDDLGAEFFEHVCLFGIAHQGPKRDPCRRQMLGNFAAGIACCSGE